MQSASNLRLLVCWSAAHSPPTNLPFGSLKWYGIKLATVSWSPLFCMPKSNCSDWLTPSLIHWLDCAAINTVCSQCGDDPSTSSLSFAYEDTRPPLCASSYSWSVPTNAAWTFAALRAYQNAQSVRMAPFVLCHRQDTRPIAAAPSSYLEQTGVRSIRTSVPCWQSNQQIIAPCLTPAIHEIHAKIP